jgi:hypothetical protein
MNIAGAPKDDNTQAGGFEHLGGSKFLPFSPAPARVDSVHKRRSRACYFLLFSKFEQPPNLPNLLQSVITTTSQPASQPAADWASCPLPSSATCRYHLSSSVIAAAAQIPAIQIHKIRLPFESSFFFSLSLSLSFLPFQTSSSPSPTGRLGSHYYGLPVCYACRLLPGDPYFCTQPTSYNPSLLAASLCISFIYLFIFIFIFI